MGNLNESFTNLEVTGSMAVGRQALFRSRVKVAGSACIKHNLTVEGWLDAPNLRNPALGLFLTADELQQAYPEPRSGSWALVGDTLPAPLYVARGRKWVNTGNMAGQPLVGMYDSPETPSGPADETGEATTCNCHDSIMALEQNVEATALATEKAYNRARANGILPFDGFNPLRGGARPTKGVWYVPPQPNFPGTFWVISSDFGLTHNDYNDPELTLQGDPDVSPARTDCLYRCDNAIYAFDGNDLTVVASEPELIESADEMAAMIADGNTRRGQIYCVVDPGSRMVNSIYVG